MFSLPEKIGDAHAADNKHLSTANVNKDLELPAKSQSVSMPMNPEAVVQRGAAQDLSRNKG